MSPPTAAPRKTTIHSTADVETEYLTPAMGRDFRPSVEAWARDARAHRNAVGARADLDVAYGVGARQRLDIFPPEGGPGGPIALCIHGSYWQYVDQSSFSHN